MLNIKLIIFFGIAVITPLMLRLLWDELPLYRRVLRFYPLVIITSGLALLIGRGTIGALLALAWGGFTLLIALNGVARLLTRPALLIEEVCLDIGMIYGAISGFWFVGYFGMDRFLGFGDTLVLLTAAHFCYISYGALILAGMLGRANPSPEKITPSFLPRQRGRVGWGLASTSKVYQVAASGMIISPPIVAAGITWTSRSSSVSILEPIGAILLAGSFTALAVGLLHNLLSSNKSGVGLKEYLKSANTPLSLTLSPKRVTLRERGSKSLPQRVAHWRPKEGDLEWGARHLRAARLLLLTSALATLFTMGLAVLYAISHYADLRLIRISQMVTLHGWINAVLVVGCGLWGWNLIKPAPRLPIAQIPFSRLMIWNRHIGATFFERIGALETSRKPVTGIVDSLDDYQNAEFDPRGIAPEIRAFYENTAAHDLFVYPIWQPGFHWLARLYQQISQRIEQMNFPLGAETAQVSSQIIPLSDRVDGRTRVRGWIRTYTESQTAIYVAAYSSHSDDQRRYMNIAFPLPGGNLTSILRLSLAPRLILSSLTTPESLGQQGVYFVNRLLPIRLPINETIEVFTDLGAADQFPAEIEWTTLGKVFARHTMWLCGWHCLTLYYAISAAPTSR